MQDSFGNIRYYGENPNNYVTFNDEVAGWRIIGVFDVEDENGNIEKRLKLIRTTSIGSYSWNASDTKYTQVNNAPNKTSRTLIPKFLLGDACGSSFGNKWIDADLNYELNSIYYNKAKGNCYVYSKTEECDFTSIGLNNDARNMIGKAKFYLGEIDGISGTLNYYPNEEYEQERKNNDSTSFIVANIGLIYASDFEYAKDISTCTNSSCNYKSWLYKSNELWWTITTLKNYQCRAVGADGTTLDGGSYMVNVNTINQVYPVLYLKSSVKITGGVGNKNRPYILSLN